MEASGVTPRGAVHAPDLARLFEQPGPFLSLYLATEAEIENAAQRSLTRWKSVREQLRRDGTDENVLAAVDPLVPDAHLDGQTLAVIAHPGGLLHVAHQPEPPARDVARWSPLPAVGPLLEWRQLSAPHVIVLADRQGADLVAVRREVGPVEREVGGHDDPLHKAKPGGWSQRRYQQRAENTWEHNADDVAKELTRLVEDVDARLVVVAGDVRAVQLLKEALPDEVLTLVREVPGSTLDEIADHVVRLVSSAVAEDTVALLRKFKEEKGQHDRAASGVTETMAALAQAKVEVLLIHDDPDDTRTAWFGPERVHLADRPDDLEGMGVDAPEQGRLVDVLLRGALGTGAGVRIVPGAAAVPEGVGAILRWR